MRLGSTQQGLIDVTTCSHHSSKTSLPNNCNPTHRIAMELVKETPSNAHLSECLAAVGYGVQEQRTCAPAPPICQHQPCCRHQHPNIQSGVLAAPHQQLGHCWWLGGGAHHVQQQPLHRTARLASQLAYSSTVTASAVQHSLAWYQTLCTNHCRASPGPSIAFEGGDLGSDSAHTSHCPMAWPSASSLEGAARSTASGTGCRWNDILQHNQHTLGRCKSCLGNTRKENVPMFTKSRCASPCSPCAYCRPQLLLELLM